MIAPETHHDSFEDNLPILFTGNFKFRNQTIMSPPRITKAKGYCHLPLTFRKLPGELKEQIVLTHGDSGLGGEELGTGDKDVDLSATQRHLRCVNSPIEARSQKWAARRAISDDATRSHVHVHFIARAHAWRVLCG